MRIAHLSDLHFASWDWNVSHFFSKRWLGNLNFLFGRRSHFDHARLEKIPSLLKSLDVSHVVITGDLSTTSAPAEFSMAKEYIAQIEAQGLPVFCIPGNHDHYTRTAYKDRHFYDYFPKSWGLGDLKESGVTAKKLGSGWWIVGLDTALATSWLHSTGHFTPHIELALEQLLQTIPADDQIVLVNHFPFFQHEPPRKRLVRGLDLQNVIEKHPNIKLYLHGHTHRRCVAPLSASGLPLILDPGSTPHRKKGGWNLIDLKSNKPRLEQYTWDQTQWTLTSSDHYDLV